MTTILHCYGNMFTELVPVNDRGIHRQTHILSSDMTWTAQKAVPLTILLVLCLLQWEHAYLAMPSNEEEICIPTDW
jgi:hypothetical protein